SSFLILRFFSQWVEESFTQFENGINWRSYVVCDVAYNNVNNWLWTPFIERGPANRMYIEVKFSMRDCSLFPGTALSCKETFSLLYYEFDAATKEPPFWEPESYKLIDRIAADEGRFTNSADIIINAEVRSIPVTKKGIYFAFRDQGACISLLAIKVYYITCPEITKAFAHFPTTPTGAEVTSIEQAKGVCVAHAREDPPANFLCTGDGQWSLLSGGCACLPGYQGNVEKQSCDVCPPGKFKDAVGASTCRACPDHSAAPHAGATECRCDTGYYRAHKDPRSMPCTLPAMVGNVHVTSVKETEIPPGFLGCFPKYPINEIEMYEVLFGNVEGKEQFTSLLQQRKGSFCRGTDECNKKQPSDCDTLEYRNGEGLIVTFMHGVLENPPIVQTHITGMTTPLFTQVGHHRTYIDPHTYEDPNQAIREFAREIDASYITIEAIIGGGEFGDVCKGKLQLPSRPEMTVAIKTLKPGSSEKARVDFLTEASIMGQFEHPNVIFLQGVVTKSNPVMIITEYMENGSLDHFLRVNDGKFQVLQLVGMLRCIASGMQYLSEMNYVHRDLAARNVLVNAQLICKIADFGLSREIESHTEGAYTTRGGKIPVRWTAPEAIAFRKFTSASDVWSLGIVMWEVMSYGERPYWNWSNQDVIKSIEKGYRLPAPMECPEAIYQLMLDCWQKERNHRPNFASIVRTLDRLIRTPEALNKVAQNRCTTALGLDSVDMTQLTSVEDWLASIKMTRYLDNFQRTGLTDLEAVARLTQHDLTQLGITLVGHQKKILQSIHTMRTQLAVNMSEGFLV
ncbi:ephrin type-B receptor 1-like, partial [Penaeus chinensis]|uniref:ephrin type-B receptor 1-like n=1 Tax=Penaeus chinensis TaxID=139456 RepID=UPI001FB6E3A0